LTIDELRLLIFDLVETATINGSGAAHKEFLRWSSSFKNPKPTIINRQSLESLCFCDRFD
jgi:hypothetical protein